MVIEAQANRRSLCPNARLSLSVACPLVSVYSDPLDNASQLKRFGETPAELPIDVDRWGQVNDQVPLCIQRRAVVIKRKFSLTLVRARIHFFGSVTGARREEITDSTTRAPSPLFTSVLTNTNKGLHPHLLRESPQETRVCTAKARGEDEVLVVKLWSH